MDQKSVVYIVDDDEAVREGISDLVLSMGLEVQSFAAAEEFMLAYAPGKPACLLLDVRMSGMSGMELLSKLADEDILLPTIMVTGHGDIPMATEALRMGAVDFVEKPFREQNLLTSIKRALASGEAVRDAQAQRTDLKNKLSLLTVKERQVLQSLVAGKTDKQIANEIGVTRRAAAFHRTNILEKMATTSIVELAASLARVDISP